MVREYTDIPRLEAKIIVQPLLSCKNTAVRAIRILQKLCHRRIPEFMHFMGIVELTEPLQ